jgi:predicted RNA-binding protein YlqC (UPF0109 family)
MSDTHENPQGQWGRPLKRKVKYAAPQPKEGGAAPVGPVDDPAQLANAAVIVHAERPAHAPAHAPSPARAHREPDDGDFRLRDLVGTMARGLVDHPDDVVVEIISAGGDGVLELHVHPDDLGHVIGKQGRTARSLRLTLGAAAARIERRVDLEIAD